MEDGDFAEPVLPFHVGDKRGHVARIRVPKFPFLECNRTRWRLLISTSCIPRHIAVHRRNKARSINHPTNGFMNKYARLLFGWKLCELAPTQNLYLTDRTLLGVRNENVRKSILALSLITVFLALSLPSSESFLIHSQRLITHTNSTNWSGYAIATNLKHAKNGAVSDVQGTWTVPAIVSGTPANQYSSFWIGIDGYSSSTVEQIGTDSDTNSARQPIYYAWYEMYPKYPVNLDTTTYPVSSGDTINAEITYTGSGKFTLQITDVNGGWTFSTTQTSNSAKRSSAEWIAEAPWSGGVLPLANFGTVTFSSCQATLNGHTGFISDSAWQYDAITMVTSSRTIKAQPSALSPDGSSFSITWWHQ